MIYTSLDQIVRNVLLSKRLSLHFYQEFLTHAVNCLRELTFDSLQIVNSVEIVPNSYDAADLPCGFVDDVMVGIPVGQFVKPIARRESINNLLNYNTTGQPIPYPSIETRNNSTGFFGFANTWNWMWNINDLGESTGRLFGHDSGKTRSGYKIIRERGQIQFTEKCTASKYIIIFISDGQSIDNATRITPLAFSTIESYVNWKRSKNADLINSPEGLSWVAQRKTLRSRLSDLDMQSIKQALRSAYRGSPKN